MSGRNLKGILGGLWIRWYMLRMRGLYKSIIRNRENKRDSYKWKRNSNKTVRKTLKLSDKNITG